MGDMEATFEKREGVGVVTAVGPLNAVCVDAFRGQFQRWWDGAPELRYVVLDLSGVAFMDSSGLGAVVALLRRVADRGGDMKLCGLDRNVRMVFEVTRAHRVFDIYDTADKAVHACL
jgi:anti-sigma B factor antagonist